MNRRSFVKLLAGTFVAPLALVNRAVASPPYIHPKFGRYISHKVIVNDRVPYATHYELKIFYENACEGYISYELNYKLGDSLNKMSYLEVIHSLERYNFRLSFRIHADDIYQSKYYFNVEHFYYLPEPLHPTQEGVDILFDAMSKYAATRI